MRLSSHDDTGNGRFMHSRTRRRRAAFALALGVALLALAPVASGAGKHERSVLPKDPPPQTRGNLDCSGSVTLTVGDSVSDNTSNWVNNVETYSCWGAVQAGGEAVYRLEIEGPGCHSIAAALSDGGSWDQDVFILGSCDESDCIAWDGVAAVSNCLDPGTYYVVVDGFYWSFFTLTIYDWDTIDACCPVEDACYAFDFSDSDHGFSTVSCGGNSVWEWGTPNAYVPLVDSDGEPVTTVLATDLEETYASSAGEVAVIGPVEITSDCTCMEMMHFYEIEESYDGGNVKVSTDGGATWELVHPADRYDVFITLYDDGHPTPCTSEEPVFASDSSSGFVRDCFDLSPYVGESVLIGFFFGSDSSAALNGWYIKSVRIGGPGNPVEARSWGSIKALYR
jgi:hypothetical protein